MWCVVYTHFPADDQETFGPFESEEEADSWVEMCQSKLDWKGEFFIDEMTNPKSIS